MLLLHIQSITVAMPAETAAVVCQQSSLYVAKTHLWPVLRLDELLPPAATLLWAALPAATPTALFSEADPKLVPPLPPVLAWLYWLLLTALKTKPPCA
jgi:hypothetical protein